MHESGNDISVVIRTLNEAAHIGVLLQTLRAQQQLGESLEIVLVDSGSTDKTLEIASSYDVELVQIPKSEFNYSTALNLGIEKCKGKLIFILSGHSVPTAPDWATQMIRHFHDDEVAGVYCRQEAWEHTNWHEKRRIESMFPHQSRVFCSKTDSDLKFSNAASCVRRIIWEKHKFKILPAAEDKEWAQWALENNYKLVYDAEAAVFHSHNESPRQVAKRQIEIEKAIDITKARNRTVFLTLFQATRRFVALAIYDFRIKASGSKKFRALLEDLKSCIWFIVDFKR